MVVIPRLAHCLLLPEALEEVLVQFLLELAGVADRPVVSGELMGLWVPRVAMAVKAAAVHSVRLEVVQGLDKDRGAVLKQLSGLDTELAAAAAAPVTKQLAPAFRAVLARLAS